MESNVWKSSIHIKLHELKYLLPEGDVKNTGSEELLKY